MSITRIFQLTSLNIGQQITLDDNASHHVARVLRATINQPLVVFNGLGGEYHAIISAITKKSVIVEIQSFDPREAESPLDLWLAQGISRGDKMDYTIQKAVELGVKKIIPLFTERSTVKLDEERQQKKREHWQSIAISACEQSGRNRIPTITPATTLIKAMPELSTHTCFALSPHAEKKLCDHPIPPGQPIVLLIGPEGGLSDNEMALVTREGFLPLHLGPRILRTETAGLAAITALQCLFGDLT